MYTSNICNGRNVTWISQPGYCASVYTVKKLLFSLKLFVSVGFNTTPVLLSHVFPCL